MPVFQEESHDNVNVNDAPAIVLLSKYLDVSKLRYKKEFLFQSSTFYKLFSTYILTYLGMNYEDKNERTDHGNIKK